MSWKEVLLKLNTYIEEELNIQPEEALEDTGLAYNRGLNRVQQVIWSTIFNTDDSDNLIRLDSELEDNNNKSV